MTSRLGHHSKKSAADMAVFDKKAVVNFMGGKSYELNPMDTLKMIAASSIFGEPSYYRDGVGSKSYLSKSTEYAAPSPTAADIFTEAIDAALGYDFYATLNLAVELRTTYMMRLNPAVIFIRAAIHPGRAEFNSRYPGVMRSVGKKLMIRPDDITNQFRYYMFLRRNKSGLPGVVKRTWADRLGEFDRYQMAKYQTSGMLRDMVRISHANSAIIDEMMQKDGILALDDENSVWERLRASGKSWKEILSTIKMPHMALLRNLRGILSEVHDHQYIDEVLTTLKAGVKGGKQFPFRYWSAYKAVMDSHIRDSALTDVVLTVLSDCINLSMVNVPILPGKVICLSDNSGSAWNWFPSEYGTYTVADIDNLSSVMTAANAEEGYVGYFGDQLAVERISGNTGILRQLDSLNQIYGRGKHRYVGGSTENGIWLFFEQAINERIFYDTIFIYSDMQAGRGGLYGPDPRRYFEYRYNNTSHIDVLKLLDKYRKTVNHKVNMFSVQTAGYNNSILPENLYRTSILTGWTGKEVMYASRMIQIWDEMESRKKQ